MKTDKDFDKEARATLQIRKCPSITVFVISLKSSTERRENIKRQLEASGVDFEFFNAVNGEEMSEEEIRLAVKHPKCCGLTRGEIGCSLSHIAVYKEIIKRNLPAALILEDGAKILDNFAQAANECYAFDAINNYPSIYLLTPPRKHFKKN